MSFVSYSFFILFGIVVVLRLVTDRVPSLRRPFLAFLILASLVFYGWHVPTYLFLILFSTVVDFVAGHRIAASDSVPIRRGWVTASVCTNLGVLAFFKYFNFGMAELEGLVALFGGSEATLPHLELALPIGISFYTFQSMSYTIDVYRGRLEASPSFARLLFFVSFFPQLVAGPIVRARDFLYQIDRVRRVRARVWGEGIFLIVRGFFLKVVVADNIAVLVDRYWDMGYVPDANGLLSLYMVVLFSGQIFADFAGYSSIARGVAYLLGFRLPVNFNSPYIAASFSEFWRRWHITLSQWLRDYLYISLGGNRRGTGRTYLNLFLVMLLGGLWHGAAETFVMWGVIHGVGLAVERGLGLNRQGRVLGMRVLWALVVQAFVLVAWIFFRSETLGVAVNILDSIVSGQYVPFTDSRLWWGIILLLPIAAMHARTWICERVAAARPVAVEKGFWVAVMLYLIVTAHARSQAFIYFQF